MAKHVRFECMYTRERYTVRIDRVLSVSQGACGNEVHWESGPGKTRTVSVWPATASEVAAALADAGQGDES